MEYLSIAMVIGALLAVASVVFGAKYRQGKGKAKQLVDLLNKIIDAAQDDQVTEKEFQETVTLTKNLLSSSGD
jgi:hypothetical protein